MNNKPDHNLDAASGPDSPPPGHLTSEHRFSRLERLVGPDGISRLRQATVAIIGLGGVGGAAFEALVRSGVGHFILVDHDRVALTNINRQLIATHSTIGRLKVEAAAERGRDINPSATFDTFPDFFTAERADILLAQPIDYIVDAIDSIQPKLELILLAARQGIPLISAMGTGNKMDPEQLYICDIYSTAQCPLARHMRTRLRKNGIAALTVLASRELPLAANAAAGDEPLPPGRKSIPGSTAFVPPVAGMLMAGRVVRDLLAGTGRPPQLTDASADDTIPIPDN